MKFPAFEAIDLSNEYDFNGMELNLTDIFPDQTQARKTFDENSLQELAESIKQHGIIQPIVVQRFDGDKFRIIAGERRWRAAKIAGLKTISAIVKEYNDLNRMAVSLIENIQRENLNSIEEAQAIHSLLTEHSMTHYEVAESIGKSRVAVTNLLRLLNLQPEIQKLVQNKCLEMGHARALLSLDPEQQIDVANQIINKELSVRETERLIQKIKNANTTINIPNSFNLANSEKINQWIDILSGVISSEVKINLNDKGEGKVIISVSSTDEVEWLVNLVSKNNQYLGK